ncbi:hypothetical protein F511_12819 [Dorcoceras hygrometricum]|uniref:Uncharacterized protein n=1 Tax=Dorcoceras hygrometricum TaxID=472368 RepID=A0A2Z7BI96_9LAMI|nr:hypothetical protein F511_12819 [Dorcoceras hygrometricum]
MIEPCIGLSLNSDFDHIILPFRFELKVIELENFRIRIGKVLIKGIEILDATSIGRVGGWFEIFLPRDPKNQDLLLSDLIAYSFNMHCIHAHDILHVMLFILGIIFSPELSGYCCVFVCVHGNRQTAVVPPTEQTNVQQPVSVAGQEQDVFTLVNSGRPNTFADALNREKGADAGLLRQRGAPFIPQPPQQSVPAAVPQNPPSLQQPSFRFEGGSSGRKDSIFRSKGKQFKKSGSSSSSSSGQRKFGSSQRSSESGAYCGKCGGRHATDLASLRVEKYRFLVKSTLVKVTVTPAGGIGNSRYADISVTHEDLLVLVRIEVAAGRHRA